MKASHKFSASVVCMFAVCCASARAEPVQGYVLEVGASAPMKGVSGVRVVAKDRFFGIVLAQTVTLDDGRYEMKIDGKQAATAVLFFDKVGYFKRDTQQNLTDPQKPQAEVWLSREGMPGDYAKFAVANILEQGSKGGSAASFDPFFAAISSLPAKDKLEVFKELRLKDPSIYEKFATADITYQSAEDFTTKLKSSKSADHFKGVGAYPNFGSPGTVRLYGYVPSNSNKREIEELAKQVDGFKMIHSDLTVK